MAAANNHVQDKIQRLTKYVDDLKGRLTMIPAKYKGREQVFIDWVNLEIKRTTITLNSLKG